MKRLALLCVFLMAAMAQVNNQPEFFSIDCGWVNGPAYNDTTKDLIYISDLNLIDTGINYTVKSTYTSGETGQTANLRSFPNGNHNCYQIGTIGMGNRGYIINIGYKYLIRALFLYGDYDNQNKNNSGDSFHFDLYLGVNFWQTVTIEYSDYLYIAEIVTKATADYFLVCLLDTNSGTPFISALEIRLIYNDDIFRDVDDVTSLVYSERYNLGSLVDQNVRYPNDKFDRIWRWCNANNYYNYYCPNNISTPWLVQVDSNDPYQVPSTVMQSAWVDTNITLQYHLDAPNKGYVRPTYYLYLHFAELYYLNGNGTRIFDLVLPGEISNNKGISPSYLKATHVRQVFQPNAEPVTYFNLTRAQGSTLPPILNAAEIYIPVNLSGVPTYIDDLHGMMTIKNTYKLAKWQGDPCWIKAPWDNVTCTNIASQPRVISLNLSSLRLTGDIPNAISQLTAIQSLDLSNNGFTGSIPDFLGTLSSLQMLDLSHNNLTGTIPATLIQKQNSGSLDFRWSNNSYLTMKNKSSKKNIVIPVIASVIPAVFVILLIAYIWRRRVARLSGGARRKQEKFMQSESRQFTYSELQAITDNFREIIGEGGFGKVYRGVLEDGMEVAVKLRSHQSSQGTKEFENEAWFLSRVHHRHMVQLIGFCDDGNYLALVYEYMSNGSLKNLLAGKNGNRKALSWRERLKIAVEAAQGLEYLHKGCTPPIIHRDVKTSNILLSHNLQAKIADFGLSKAYNDDYTHVTATAIVGTPGYLDPEYNKTYRLNEKSDVYSFGIVLLELATGLPAILPALMQTPSSGNRNLVNWVSMQLENGGIEDILDKNLNKEYDLSSVDTFVSLAMSCTCILSNQRPSMAEVVLQLKEILSLEIARVEPINISSETSQTGSTSMSSHLFSEIFSTGSGR